MIASALLNALSLLSLVASPAALSAAVPDTDRLAARMLVEPSGISHPSTEKPERQEAAGPPVARRHEDAVQRHAWQDGATYQLESAPGQVSDIVLQPGEALVSVAAGDTARWVIGDTTSGAGAERRAHILVKPVAAGLRTNLVIATDRRVYHVELRSRASTSMTGMAWTYPAGALIALRGSETVADLQQTIESVVAIDNLNFDYRIEGDAPSWRPVRAFDDGRQAFIEFPPTVAQGEAPPLFVRSSEGRLELVNYRLTGRYYAVDRLFGTAELRLGERRQQVVRIIRAEAAVKRRRNGS